MKILTSDNGRPRLRNRLMILVSEPAAGSGTPDPVPQGTITISNERQLRWVYQRVGTSKDVPVSGTCTAAVGTKIEARAIDETTGTPVTPWAVIATVEAGGQWSGTMNVPQGKWYRRQARIFNSTAAESIAAETMSFGVGIGIAELGQSNMANFKTSAYKYPLGDPAAMEYLSAGVMRRVGNISKKNAAGGDVYQPNTLLSSANVTGGYTSYNNTSSGGGTAADGYVYVANLVAEGTGLPVFVINMAVGGTSIETYWQTGGTGWTNFSNALTSIGKDCEICLWYQGENNATMAPSTYQGYLANVMRQFHTLTGRTTDTFKFGVISLGPTITGAAGEGYAKGDPYSFGRTRAAQCEWANSTPGAFYVTAAHDMDLTNAPDNIHIGGEGFSALGRRYAKSILAMLGYGTTSAGPRMVAASRVDNIVTVTVQHTGGTALQDGTGSDGTALKGFEFKDGAGLVVPIIATQIVNATTVQLTLNSTPTGACTLSYAQRSSPYTNDVENPKSGFLPAAILRDNAKYYSAITTNTDNPLGSPMQPCAALNVT